jgi:murein peptide amidase A
MSAGRGTARMLALGACLASLCLAFLAGQAHARPHVASPRVPIHIVIVGYSVDHRPIRAFVVGQPAAARRILVVGCIHGTEPAGQAITRRLRSVAPPAGAVWWLVDQSNPDGCLAGTRQNADGVDLNRNAPWRWQHLEQPGGTFYSGPYPLSEPESRAINRLVKRLRPAVSIWYHQHASLVDSSSGGDRAIESRYARTVGLPFRAYPFVPGSITSWQDATFPHDTAFVVELSAGALPPSSIARHVAAIIALSRPPD